MTYYESRVLRTGGVGDDLIKKLLEKESEMANKEKVIQNNYDKVEDKEEVSKKFLEETEKVIDSMMRDAAAEHLEVLYKFYDTIVHISSEKGKIEKDLLSAIKESVTAYFFEKFCRLQDEKMKVYWEIIKNIPINRLQIEEKIKSKMINLPSDKIILDTDISTYVKNMVNENKEEYDSIASYVYLWDPEEILKHFDEKVLAEANQIKDGKKSAKNIGKKKTFKKKQVVKKKISKKKTTKKSNKAKKYGKKNEE